LALTDPIIRPLRDDDGLGSLSLGAEFQSLKSFLKRHARQYERESVARSYVVVDRADRDCGGRVWGYVSLVASEIQLGATCAPAVDYWPKGYSHPAVKLARMALDGEVRGLGLGREMLSWVMALVQEKIATRIGCRVLVTDAKRSAVGFYVSVGFTMLDTETNRNSAHPVMFLPLDKR
jgi:GNAT superfamily N-acetyltransferase